MVKGYIQSISADPFYVTLFNEASVRVYHSICSCAYRCHWIDCVQHQFTKTAPLYALIVPQPNKGQALIAVTEFISSSHSNVDNFNIGKLSCLEAPHVSPNMSSCTEAQQYLGLFSLPSIMNPPSIFIRECII